MLPHLFQIGPITVYSFGLLVILGFVAATMLAARLARERGLPGDALLDIAVVVLFASIAGARLLFVALHWGYYSARPLEIPDIRQGGMSFHGGLAFGILSGVILLMRRRVPILALADAVAPAVALGYAIGRIGCLLNGCCYGGPTHLPWGMHFPDGDPHMLYHPAQIYASIINLGLLALLVRAYRLPHHVGQILALYIGGYSVYRFFIEFLRKGVTADVMFWGLTQAQVFSLFAIAGAAAWWYWLRNHTPLAPELTTPPHATPTASPRQAGA